jgi:Uma2 family endonuclease
MHVQINIPTTADEFLNWDGGREDCKYEFVDGKLIERPRGETRAHARLASRLLFLFTSGLDGGNFDVVVGGFCLSTPRGVRRPDVLVDRRTPETTGMEVMSSQSRQRDLTEKVAEYLALPTLAYYAVFSQEEPRLWLWTRLVGGASWRESAMAGLNEKVSLARLGVTVDLSDLYGGFE